MNKLSNYAKQTIAFLKGDEEGQIVARNERKADAILRGQLSSLDNKKVNAEIEVETAQDNLDRAKFPTELISDGESYLKGIREAQEHLEATQEALAEIEESIEYWTRMQEEFNKKVD